MMGENDISGKTAVYYDGACPVCRREIALYRKMVSDRIDWIDIEGLAAGQMPDGKDRSALLSRFHARSGAGEWHVGIDAFAEIWRQVPILRRLAWLLAVQPTRGIAELGYRGFLAWRKRRRGKTQADRLRREPRL